MIGELCAETRNYFVSKIQHGTFEITNGKLAPLDFLQDGQYFRIVGSTFNDGVYQFPADGLTDEVFSGAVWAMAVPPSAVALADKIKAFEEGENAQPSAFTGESFGGYSYTKATGKNGAPLRWQDVFATDLKKFRKVSVL